MASRFTDPSNFVTAIGSTPIAGIEIMSQAQQRGNELVQRASHNALARGDAARQNKIANAMTMAALDAKIAASKALQSRYDASGRRAEAGLALNREKFDYEKGMKERSLDADAVKAMMGAGASGDRNLMETARAGAIAQDPSVAVQLPGEKARPMAPGIYGVDEVFPEDTNKLRVARGGREIYMSPDAGDTAQNEKDIAARLTRNTIGNSPWAGASVETAGQGMTGVDAAKLGITEFDKQEGRDVAALNKQATLEAGKGRSDDTRAFRLEGAVQKIYDNVQKTVDANRSMGNELSIAERQLASGAPVEANLGLKQTVRSYYGKASSDKETASTQAMAGQLQRMELLLNSWTDDGRLPPELQGELGKAITFMRGDMDRMRHADGIAARDSVYRTQNLLPWQNVDQIVEQGARVYEMATGKTVPPEVMAQDKQRLLGLQGGGQPMSPLPGDAEEPAALPLQDGHLGTGDVPPIPGATPPSQAHSAQIAGAVQRMNDGRAERGKPAINSYSSPAPAPQSRMDVGQVSMQPPRQDPRLPFSIGFGPVQFRDQEENAVPPFNPQEEQAVPQFGSEDAELEELLRQMGEQM